MSLTAELKRHFEASNDPKALAAERIGRIESAYVFDLSRVSVPALVYCGSDDWPDEAAPTAKALKTDLRVLPGRDHVGAFKEAATVFEFVIPFLERLE
jgi:hypothetical protein